MSSFIAPAVSGSILLDGGGAEFNVESARNPGGISSVDGVTDNTAMIQGAIAANQITRLRAGHAYVVSQLSIPPAAIIKAEGASVKQVAGTNAAMVKFQIAAHVGTRLEGGIWDGNGLNQTAFATVIEGNSVTSYDMLQVERVTVLNAAGHGMFFSDLSHGNASKRIVGCKVANYGLFSVGFGIYCDYMGNVDIEANWVLTALGYDGIELGHSGIANLGTNAHMRARGNITINTSGGSASGIQFPFSDFAEIVDNTCIGGIINNDTNEADYVQIVNNKVIAASPSAGYAGIRWKGNFVVCAGNSVSVTTGNGIGCSGAMALCTINGNYVYSSNAGASTGSAFDDGVGSNGCTWNGNIADGVAGHGFSRGFNISTTSSNHSVLGNILTSGVFNGINNPAGSAGCIFIGNHLNVANSPVLATGGSTNYFLANTPSTGATFNSRSVVAGASPFTYANADGFAETIMLTAVGGLSALSYKGTPGAAITAGIPFVLRPGDQMVFTWVTTAPVFQVLPLP